MRRIVATVGLIAMGALGTACGGDDDDGGEAGSTSPAATDAPATSAAAATSAAPATSATAPATTAAGTAPTASGGGAGGEVAIEISDFTFEIAGPITAGQAVTVQNNDTAAHTVTAEDDSFSVEIPGGGTAELTVPEAGSYAIVCNFHANMQATLEVE